MQLIDWNGPFLFSFVWYFEVTEKFGNYLIDFYILLEIGFQKFHPCVEQIYIGNIFRANILYIENMFKVDIYKEIFEEQIYKENTCRAKIYRKYVKSKNIKKYVASKYI